MYGCCMSLLACSPALILSLVTNTIVFSNIPGPCDTLFVGGSSSAAALDPSPTGRGTAADGDDDDDDDAEEESSQFSYRALLLLRRPPPLISERHREKKYRTPLEARLKVDDAYGICS